MRKMLLAVMISVTSGAVALVLPISVFSNGLKCPQEEFLAVYYKGSNFNYQSSSRCEHQPENRNSLLPEVLPGGVGPDNFSVLWTGQFFFKDKTYLFQAEADDGIRIWLDGHLIINEWRLQGEANRYRAIRSLKEGIHAIRIEYFNGNGKAVAKFHWKPHKHPIQIFGAF
jgi:hypothetical protein